MAETEDSKKPNLCTLANLKKVHLQINVQGWVRRDDRKEKSGNLERVELMACFAVVHGLLMLHMTQRAFVVMRCAVRVCRFQVLRFVNEAFFLMTLETCVAIRIGRLGHVIAVTVLTSNTAAGMSNINAIIKVLETYDTRR